nr:hypothetical protein B0A51_09933 [Rachicladosporium sp. CCFEE 5018]
MHNGREEVWTHRMLYIVAKVCNFRATVPRNADKNSKDHQIRTQQRYEEWMRLKGMADAWNENIPRTMHPMAYVFGYQTSNKSCFPEVWLIKRTSIVARLFYHTAMLLLAQVNPYMSVEAGGEMTDLQNRHAQMICGITAHVKDRGVASVAIRSLAHAGEVIKDRREQEEILTIFEKINKETGWRIGFVYKELKERWGWQEEVSPMQWNQTHTAARQQKEAEEARQQLQADLQQQQAQAAQQQQQQGMQNMQLQQGFDFSAQSTPSSTMSMQQPMHQPQAHLLPPPANPQHHQRSSTSSSTSSGSSVPGSGKKPPSGILNPIYKTADFTLPQHPYQNFYVAPSAGHGHAQGGLCSPTGIYKFTSGQMAGLGSAIGFPLALALLVSLLLLRKEKHKHSPPKLMYKLPDNHTEFSFRPPPPLRTQSAMSLGSYHSDRPHSRRDSTGMTATANSKPIHLQSFPERYEQLKNAKVSEFAVERHELDGTLPTYGSRHELAEKHHS